MKLVIVESPTKTKSLSKYLGKDFEVMASMGHVRDLPKSKMGIEVEEKSGKFKFKPEYITVRGKGKQVKKIKKKAKEADEVILATDPDREGEAIAFHVKHYLDKEKVDEVNRVVFHSITKGAVLKAMKKAGKVDMDLYHAQQARRLLDRIVGYTLSPVLWKKVRTGLSAGRVQSVALRLVVEREEEREVFDPEEYWVIKALTKTKKKDDLEVELWKIDGKREEIDSKKKAKKVEKDLKKDDLKVTAVEEKKRSRKPRSAYKTSTLQRAAATVLGWSSKKTMMIAQRLYEQGDITYHRTDSINLAKSATSKVRKLVKDKWGEKFLPEKARKYKNKKGVVAQEAHEAIRPTKLKVEPGQFEGQGKTAKDQNRLYDLIWRRTISSQMKSAIYEGVKIMVEDKSGKYLLRAKGERLVFTGWRELYKKFEKEDEEMPEVEKGEELDLQKVDLEQKFTRPPARYNDASLVKELERKGIGRPSTYASIIGTLLSRRYVVREEKRFMPTSIGKAVCKFLMEHFKRAMDYDFTREMEDGLDDIARGELKWQKYLSDFYKSFHKNVEEVEENAERVELPVEKTGKKCPKCDKGEVIIREGRYGKFYSCDQFPDCKYTKDYKEYLKDFKCPECGAKVVIKKTRRGKTFYGCGKYPKCDWASWKDPRKKGKKS